jgi:long-chain acyl-CoA synthetase
LWNQVQCAALALRRLGLEPGDRLAIMSRTCREWQVAELAAALIGASIVGIDVHAAPGQASWMLEHVGASALVVDRQQTLSRLQIDLPQRLKFVLEFEPAGSQSSRQTVSWHEAIAQSEPPVKADWVLSADAAATVLFTSGTTGQPKAIEYTHRQIMTACWAMLEAFPGFEKSRVVCWLPMSALFQRMMNLLACANGSITYFVEDPRDIMARLPEIRPTVLTSVPRFYEKVHDGVQEQLAGLSGFQARLVRIALKTGAARSRAIQDGVAPGLWLRLVDAGLDQLVLRRIRAALGGEIKWMISGSAAAPLWLLEFFDAIGLPILEAYGVTENPVPIAANRPQAYRFGSVGHPLPTNDVRLAEDGEVLVKGPAMFRGYLFEEVPSGRFTPDMYYRTGDYGRVDAKGFLYLTGRSADLIKTSTGRRIAPAAIESVYCKSRYIDQMIVIGNDRPHLAGLIAPNWPAVKTALRGSVGADRRESELAHSPVVTNLIERELAICGVELAEYQQIHAFTVLDAPFSVEHGELTTTLKLRRSAIEARHARTIDDMYKGSVYGHARRA